MTGQCKHTPEIDLAVKALKLKMDKCITGRISYDLFEAQALLNAIQDQKETQEELLEALKEARFGLLHGSEYYDIEAQIKLLDAAIAKATQS